MSSSGFVPAPFSNRVPKEYCVLFKTPLAVEIVPLPSFNPPDQWALPVRCISSPYLAEIVASLSYTTCAMSCRTMKPRHRDKVLISAVLIQDRVQSAHHRSIEIRAAQVIPATRANQFATSVF